MPVSVVSHPLFDEALSQLRDKRTNSETFRMFAKRAGTILAVEATRTLLTKESKLETPLRPYSGSVLANTSVIAPVLRAGLSLVEPFLEVLPAAKVGHIGLRRNEKTAETERYSSSLPRLESSDIFILDPMLATGGSACTALEMVSNSRASSITFVSVIAAPEGIKRVQDKFPEISIVVGAVDECLDERFFIVPGLGDFGDRLFGTE